MRSNFIWRFKHNSSCRGLFFILFSPFLFGIAKANELTLSISLGLSPQQAEQVYRPLISYLAEASGQRIKLITSINSLAHWQLMRREPYDLVLDGPAFTAYRAEKMDYSVVAKLPDVLSFTLVAHSDLMLFEADELIGRAIATQPSPSLGALRLAELYSNPMRQPDHVQTDTHQQAAEAVLSGRAAGAMLPSALVGNYANLSTILTTDQVPAPGFSVSSRVSPQLRERIQAALLNAPDSEAGRAMLEALNVTHFESADNATYNGLETMLEGLWGY